MMNEEAVKELVVRIILTADEIYHAKEVIKEISKHHFSREWTVDFRKLVKENTARIKVDLEELANIVNNGEGFTMELVSLTIAKAWLDVDYYPIEALEFLTKSCGIATCYWFRITEE